MRDFTTAPQRAARFSALERCGGPERVSIGRLDPALTLSASRTKVRRTKVSKTKGFTEPVSIEFFDPRFDQLGDLTRRRGPNLLEAAHEGAFQCVTATHGN